MAYLTSEQINEVRTALAQEMSRLFEETDLTKSQWRTCLEEVDEWQEDNKASYLAAISEPAASSLTAKEKAKVFFLVAQKKYNIL